MLLRHTALALGLALLASACGSANDGAPGAPAAGPPVSVGLQTLASTPVEQATDFVGTVRSRRSTTIQPQVEGFLTRIMVKSGDRVSRGTPLFVVDSSSQQAAVSTLRSQRAAREADAVLSQQQAQRARALLDVGATTNIEVIDAQRSARDAETAATQAEDAVRRAKLDLLVATGRFPA